MPFPQKVRLGGADCFHLALDRHARTHAAGGNVVRMAFFMGEGITKEELQERLDQVPIISWLCNIRLRDGFFFSIPYWEFLPDQGFKVEIREHESESGPDLPAELFKRDIPLTAARFFEADLIHYPGGRSTILFSWNHILLDGRGSGMLFNYLNDPSKHVPLSSFFPVEKKSPGWIKYIRNMYAVKHFIEQNTKGNIVSVYSCQANQDKHPEFRNKVIRYSHAETVLLEKNAKKNGTRFGVNSFLIAACVNAVNKVLQGRGIQGDMWLPIPYDGRKRGAFGPIISNNVSMVFYTVPREKMKAIPDLVAHISQEMNKQLKDEIPHKYALLLDLMRHIPSRLYYNLVNRPGEGALSSFLFTATGEGIGDMRSLFGRPLSDVVIYSPETYPPGLTFLFLRFNNQIKVSISYSKQVIREEEILLIEQELKTVLLQDEN